MKKVNDIHAGRHCVFLLHDHLVFIQNIAMASSQRLFEIFAGVCRDFAAELVEFDGEDDHVRLLVVYPPKVAVSSLVNSLKGVSGRLIRKKGYPSIQKNSGAALSGRQAILPEAAEGRRVLYYGSISKLNKRPMKGKNSG